MRGFAKSQLERLAGDRFWLEHSADPDEVRQLIKRLSPVAIEREMIRVGSPVDGGYVAPDDFEGITTAVSPGVSTEVSFDLMLAERGIEIYMADASVPAPPVQNPRFHFHKKFLDVFEDHDNMRMDTLCASIDPAHAGDRILQMDIEGAEYRVLLDASDETLKSFRIMLIEFHDLDRMFAAFPMRMIKATFDKLLRFHDIVHIHPNNVSGPRVRGDIEIPPVMEFTLYRKDRSVVVPGQKLAFPHPLDQDNLPHLPGYALPDCWR
jgi:hypothetical protein